MARHYSSKDFFRQMPNRLLGRYFLAQGVFAELDFEGMKETQPDELFRAWLQLPGTQRNRMDAEFRDIFELGCEKGFRAILDEAEWHYRQDPAARTTFVETFAALPNHYERAMLAFLDYKNLWRGASLFYHADTLPYWRKRKNLPQVPAAVDEATLRQLAESLRAYFHFTEGRGNNCTVEPFRRCELDYFFCYPEDYSQHSVEWVDGQFDRRPHNPAFEVIYVYSQRDGTLDLNFTGSYKAVEPLQGIFATTILKLDELPADPRDGRVYNLDPLRQNGFQFVFDAASGIQDVIVRKLRLTSRVTKGDRLTVEADPSRDTDAVYKLLGRIAAALPLSLYNVTQVELAAYMAVEPGKPPKAVPIRITYPNSCTLKYDEIGLKLRQMLCASGLEPKQPDKPADTAATSPG